MSKIYTKTGDKGKTSLMDGTRVPKNHKRVETYGTIDELNSAIGVAIAEISNGKNVIPAKAGIQGYGSRIKVRDDRGSLEKILLQIQKNLFEIGSMLANPLITHDSSLITHLDSRVESFEKLIDSMTAQLPPLTNFILPGGGRVGAFLHLARTVCRRVERNIIALSQEETVDGSIIRYFNRLSDLLFTMSRFANSLEKKKETIWEKRK